MSDTIYAAQVVCSIFQPTQLISSQSVVAQKYDLQNVNYRYVLTNNLTNKVSSHQKLR